MIISSKVWLALSHSAKLAYLNMYGKIVVDFGSYTQEVRREDLEKKAHA